MKKLSHILFLLIVSFCGIWAQQLARPELSSIEFIGNNNISRSELLGVILSRESASGFSQFLNKFTSFGGPALYFDSLLIPTDIEAIKNLYRSRGFFKCRLKSEYKIDNGSALLRFIIDEGEPAFFKSFTIDGISEIPDIFRNDINDFIASEANSVYRDDIVEGIKNYTLSYLRDHGYMLARFERPKVIIDTMSNSVEVKIFFEPGKRYKISEIYTSRTGAGLHLVTDDLIKELVGIKPGQYYSNYDIQRGQVRLYRTDLFTSAYINGVISDTSGNRVPLNISADIGLLQELSPEIIMNDEDNTFNLGMGLSFTRKNFLGDARKFTIGTSAAAQNVSEFFKSPSFNDSTVFGYADARISIEQPFIFGSPINTRLETYYTLQKRKNEYNSTLLGGKINFDFELPQFTYFTSFSAYFNIVRAEYVYKHEYLINVVSSSYQRISEGELSRRQADSLAALLIDADLPSQSTNALLGLSLGANKTNNPIFPNSGYSISLQLEDANSIPFLISRLFNSEFTNPLFFKIIASSSIYFPIYSSVENSFGIKLKIGQVFTYRGNKADISINQRLYSGGSNSLRGWSTRELVPKDPLLNLSNPSQEELEAILIRGATTGGFFLFEGSIETRNRLFGKFGSVLFIDYGNTWNSSREVQLNQIAVAAGFGFRYYSDFAPIRIDFGFKAYDPNDRRSIFKKVLWKDLLQFHIGIGEAF